MHGDVTAALRGDDLDQVTLAPGDVVLLEFPADTIAAGHTRDVVLVTDGLWTGPGGVPARQAQAGYVEEPSLRVLGPLPVRGPVTLQMTLPAETPVALQIFDVQGRHVRTLLDGKEPAGRHFVTWDLRDERGSGPGAGVYFARLAAGGRATEVRKLHVVR